MNKQSQAQINKMIGSFLAVFGIAVIIAIFFTTTFHGRIVNLAAGLLLLLCGGFALFMSYRAGKKE